MSQIAMTVIDAERSIWGRPHASFADQVLGSLAAEPASIAELEEALKRFEPDGGDFFAGWHEGTCDEPFEAGVCVVDLSARLVAARSTYSPLGPHGEVTYRRDGRATDIQVRYRLSDDWLFADVESWENQAELRRKERKVEPPLDARPVLYGEVCPFIVRECLAARGSGEPTADWSPPNIWSPHELPERAEPEGKLSAEDAVAEIHARWLMTPRAGLAGKTPREVMLEKQNFIDVDLDTRCEQWSRTKECPVGLSPASAAFRLGGFGLHESILYYDLVRHLVEQCWDCVVGPEAAKQPDVVDQTKRLQTDMQQWLNTPQEDLSGWTPSLAIERERMRLPMAVSGEDAMVDDDCPLCQMMADAGPMFWHLDGCNMDQDFPFSFEPSRAVWEAEEADRKVRDAQWEEQWAAEERRRKEACIDDDPIWQHSMSDPAAADQSPEIALFGIGMHLTELIADVKETPETAPFADTLNRHFGNLRDAVKNPDGAPIDPIITRFGEELETIATTMPPIARKCADLEEKLTWLGSHFAG